MDRYSEKELQPTIPHVVWAQHKLFYPGLASEDEVLSVESIICLVRKWSNGSFSNGSFHSTEVIASAAVKQCRINSVRKHWYYMWTGFLLLHIN